MEATAPDADGSAASPPAPEAGPSPPAPEAGPSRPAPEAGPSPPAPEAGPSPPAPEAGPSPPAATGLKVEVRQLTKRFDGGERAAVDGVDIATEEGEYLVLLGPSGCGKTTLLRMIAGLEHQTSGDVLIGGHVVNGLPPRARGIVMVFQSYALIAELDLQDSLWSLVLIYPTITVPVAVWLLIGFFRAIPKEVEEQAMVDGLSRFAAFWRMAVPLAFPGIVAVIVFAFTLCAHEFIYALAFKRRVGEHHVERGGADGADPRRRVLLAVDPGGVDRGPIPIALVFNLLLERFVTGFTMGAVKG